MLRKTAVGEPVVFHVPARLINAAAPEPVTEEPERTSWASVPSAP